MLIASNSVLEFIIYTNNLRSVLVQVDDLNTVLLSKTSIASIYKLSWYTSLFGSTEGLVTFVCHVDTSI